MSSFDFGLALQRMFTNNFARKTTEKILFITDFAPENYNELIPPTRIQMINERAKFAELLYLLSKDIYHSEFVVFKKYPATLSGGKEPPAEIAEEMKNCDIFLALTTYSLTYTNARRDACNAGARGASMPGFTPDMFYDERPMAIDYQKIKFHGDLLITEIEKIQQNKTDYCQIKLVDHEKNALTFQILGPNQTFVQDMGLYYEKGSFGNLPAGEIYFVPIEGTANGKLTIPKEWMKHALDNDTPVELVFEKGKLIRLEGVKKEISDLFGFTEGPKSPDTVDLLNSRRNLAEFGIGLNPYATKFDSIVESEKILGSVHIALGSNDSFGGDVHSDIHIDFILPGATVYINDKPLIMNGIHVYKTDQ